MLARGSSGTDLTQTKTYTGSAFGFKKFGENIILFVEAANSYVWRKQCGCASLLTGKELRNNSHCSERQWIWRIMSIMTNWQSFFANVWWITELLVGLLMFYFAAYRTSSVPHVLCVQKQNRLKTASNEPKKKLDWQNYHRKFEFRNHENDWRLKIASFSRRANAAAKDMTNN